jgi:hypothetical protein
MKECTTHHHACECREEKVARLYTALKMKMCYGLEKRKSATATVEIDRNCWNVLKEWEDQK